MRMRALLACLLLPIGADAETGPPPSDLARLLAADDEGFARALLPRRFEFPADHGPHPEFRNEWWYVTGNLDTTDGRRFGYELTIFRFSLSPQPPASSSAWSSNQVYIAHLAVTDAEGDRFLVSQRYSRGALGLAGAESDHQALMVKKALFATGEDVYTKQAVEYLADELNSGKLKVKKVDKSVTFHDPCDLGRAAREFEAPRQVIAGLPGVDTVAVVGMKHRLFDEGVFAYVRPEAGAELTPQAVQDHCRKIASYKRPQHVELWPADEEFPITRSTKVDKLAIQKIAAERIAELREKGAWDA